MSTRNAIETQAFIELLYERSGRTDGRYTGLFQAWSKATLSKARKDELDRIVVPGRHSRRSWLPRVFGDLQGETKARAPRQKG